MAKKKEPRREELRKNLATKKVYHFVNDDTGVDVKCKELYKKKKLIVHFPFNRDGSPKYKSVKKFVFEGFADNTSLPVGIQKSAVFGLGFTKYLAPLMDAVLDKHKITEVVVTKAGTPSLTASKLALTEASLKTLYPKFKHINDVQKQDRLDLATAELHGLFPSKIKLSKKKYVKNSVYSALESWSQNLDDFSDNDKAAIKELFDKLVIKDDFLTTDMLLQTKDRIDQQYVEDAISGYRKLMSQQSETSVLEKKWQKFLRKHNWVFSYLFAYPIMLVQDEAYVGGKALSNKNGKVTDFLLKNSLTHNVAFLEIKTHKTELIGTKKPYRGDDVFPVSKDVTGGITQVLNQRDNFQKEYFAHRAKASEHIESLNSRCVVLMGSLSDLDPKQLGGFELFRNNSRDVEIVTFDELLARLETITKLLSAS